MKTISIFAISMLVAVFAFGQNRNVEEVEISAPQFMGIKNAVAVVNESPNTQIKAYLKENLVYPQEAANCNIEGTEVVEFTVTTKGNVTDFKIINSVCPLIDEEVISVLQQTNGMWLPGTKNGNPADVSMELPFTFCTSKTPSKSVHEIFTEKATAYFVRATEMLFEKDNAKKALKYYNMGVTYLPYDKSLLLLRGMCRYELGDKEGATADWTRMRDLGCSIEMTEVVQMESMKGYDELVAILKNNPTTILFENHPHFYGWFFC